MATMYGGKGVARTQIGEDRAAADSRQGRSPGRERKQGRRRLTKRAHLFVTRRVRPIGREIQQGRERSGVGNTACCWAGLHVGPCEEGS